MPTAIEIGLGETRSGVQKEAEQQHKQCVYRQELGRTNRTGKKCICAPLKTDDSTTAGGNEQHEGLITDLRRRTAENVRLRGRDIRWLFESYDEGTLLL